MTRHDTNRFVKENPLCINMLNTLNTNNIINRVTPVRWIMHNDSHLDFHVLLSKGFRDLLTFPHSLFP